MTDTPRVQRSTIEEFTFVIWDGPVRLTQMTFFGYGTSYADRVRDARRQAVRWHGEFIASLVMVRDDGMALIPDTPCGPRDAHS